MGNEEKFQILELENLLLIHSNITGLIIVC